MEIKMFNLWYFFWLTLSVGSFFGLYFLLKNKSQKTQKITLFSILAFALVLHFCKRLWYPYNQDVSAWYRDSWFINICGANICLFPFMFIVKNKAVKDYMFFLGILGGFLACILPIEAIEKPDQSKEVLEIIRFYIHHTILWVVPVLMVKLKVHTLSYKRFYKTPVIFMVVLLFIMLNQIFQSELGFISLRNDDFLNINYRNTSYIWAPGNDAIGKIFSVLCPDFFKTVPVGEFAGQQKYWPWFWLIIPVFTYMLPITFIVTAIIDRKNFVSDFKRFKTYLKTKLNKTK